MFYFVVFCIAFVLCFCFWLIGTIHIFIKFISMVQNDKLLFRPLLPYIFIYYVPALLCFIVSLLIKMFSRYL